MNWAVSKDNPTLLVSDTGRVVRMASSRQKRYRNGMVIWQTYPEKELRPRRIGAGYLGIQVKLDGSRKDLYVHRLVAEAFVPRLPHRTEVNHKDGDKQNNCASNLEWTTHSENHQHAAKTGLSAVVVFSPEQVLEVKRQLVNGARVKDVAASFGTTTSAISHIKNGHTWSWLDADNRDAAVTASKG
jgi:hypothetical protein